MRQSGLFPFLVWSSLLSCCWSQGPLEGRLEDLGSVSPAVRRQAAAALGRMADPSAVLPLSGALRDPEKEVRREAAKALGAIKQAAAAGPLVEALADRDANVRAYAAYALGEIKEARATAALLKALADPEWCVRDQAAWALRELGDPAIIPALTAALSAESADVAHITWLLRQMPGARLVEPLSGLLAGASPAVRIRAIEVLGGLTEKGAIEAVISSLNDSQPPVRQSAVLALFRANDHRALPPLRELAAREQDPAVREAAEKAVFQLSRRGDLVAHWSFDDRNEEVAKDVTGRGSDGRIFGCVAVEGKVGYALRFGENTYIELGKPAGVPQGPQPATVMAWARSEAPSGVVIARGGAFSGFSLYIKDGLPKFGVHIDRDGPALIAAGREEVVGSWVHLAGVMREDQIELYVDGKLAGAAKTTGIPSGGGQGMEIGFDVGNSPAEITDHFHGIIDEVKIFSEALSAEEIADQCDRCN